MQLYFYVLRHPVHGTYWVDTGVERGFSAPEGNPRLSWLVADGLNLEALNIHHLSGDWLDAHGGEIAGVMLTHMHLDHIMGLPDLPRTTKLFTGPGEAEDSKFLNLFIQGTTDRMLEGFPEISEWKFGGDTGGRFEGVVDVFGDGSLWALHVPGHTAGSTAYLVRSTDGPKLLVGDACHTRWGWDNGVEPGHYSNDRQASVPSLQALRKLAAENSLIEVHLGHQ